MSNLGSYGRKSATRRADRRFAWQERGKEALAGQSFARISSRGFGQLIEGMAQVGLALEPTPISALAGF